MRKPNFGDLKQFSQSHPISDRNRIQNRLLWFPNLHHFSHIAKLYYLLICLSVFLLQFFLQFFSHMPVQAFLDILFPLYSSVLFFSLLIFGDITEVKTSLVAQTIKCLPTMRETRVQSLCWEDLLEKEMATHSSILAWKIPWREEPGGLQSMGSQSQTRPSNFTFTFSFQIYLI